jgi:hypothetical protein
VLLTYLLRWLGYNPSTPPLNGSEPARLMGNFFYGSWGPCYKRQPLHCWC